MDSTVAVALVGGIGTTLAALAGVAGAVYGPIRAAKQSAHLARESQFADLQRALYLRALTYVEDVSIQLDRMTDPEADKAANTSAAATRGDITAEMRLMAEQQVLDAWLKLVNADVALTYREDMDDTLRRGNLVDWREPVIKEAAAAIAAFRNAVRNAALQ